MVRWYRVIHGWYCVDGLRLYTHTHPHSNVHAGGREALSDKDLMAAHLLYGATTNDDKLRPDGRRGEKNKKQPMSSR